MDLVRGVAASLCVSLLGAGAFSLLVPKGSLEGMMKFALSLFVLAGFALPFFGQGLDWNSLWDEASFSASVTKTQEKLKETEKAVLQTVLEQQLLSTLSEQGFHPQKVELSIHTSQSQNIEIEQVRLWLSDEDKGQGSGLLALVEQQLGTERITLYWT